LKTAGSRAEFLDFDFGNQICFGKWDIILIQGKISKFGQDNAF
jgi:hypothetical protein